MQPTKTKERAQIPVKYNLCEKTSSDDATECVNQPPDCNPKDSKGGPLAMPTQDKPKAGERRTLLVVDANSNFTHKGGKLAASYAQENDSNSTYCEQCGCRITIGRCKHGVMPPPKAGEPPTQAHTPRTDACAQRPDEFMPVSDWVPVGFSRKLERELTETKAQRDELLAAHKQMLDALRISEEALSVLRAQHENRGDYYEGHATSALISVRSAIAFAEPKAAIARAEAKL